MGWETRFQNNDPSYLEPRITNAESSLAEMSKQQIIVAGSGGDDTQALQNAISQLTSGSTLIIKGKVTFTSNITVTGISNVTVKGDGSKTSYLHNNSTGSTFTVKNAYYWSFDGVGIIGNGDPATYGNGATSGDGLTLDACGLFTYTNVDISYHGGMGINAINGTYGMTFDNCRIIGNQKQGVTALSLGTQNASFFFTNTTIYKNKLQGIWWSAPALGIVNCIIESNQRGIHFDSSQTGCTSPTNAVTIIGTDMENNTYEQIKNTPSATYQLVGFEMTGCQLLNSYTGADKVSALIVLDSSSLLVGSFKLGANNYGGLTNGYDVINANNTLNGSSEIMYVNGQSQNYYKNLGRCKIKGLNQIRAVNGLIEQKGISFTTPDISDELIGVTNPTGYWRLPISEFGYISNLQLICTSDATTQYSCAYTIYTQNSDGSFNAFSSGTINSPAGGGNATLTLSLGLGINPNTNSIMIVKTALTKPSNGTTFKVKCLVCSGSF